jgi:hypothetical protein
LPRTAAQFQELIELSDKTARNPSAESLQQTLLAGSVILALPVTNVAKPVSRVPELIWID